MFIVLFMQYCVIKMQCVSLCLFVPSVLLIFRKTVVTATGKLKEGRKWERKDGEKQLCHGDGEANLRDKINKHKKRQSDQNIFENTTRTIKASCHTDTTYLPRILHGYKWVTEFT